MKSQDRKNFHRHFFFRGSIAVLFFLITFSAHAADGDVDLQFSGHALNSSFVEAVAVQSDGKILIGGWFTAVNGTLRQFLVRLNQNGSIDPSFTSPIIGAVRSLIVQPDGKIIVGGGKVTIGGQSRIGINRLEPDGSPDLAFFGTGNGTSGGNNVVYTTVLQADGKILVAGQFDHLNDGNQASLARLNADGTVDTGFVGSAWATGTSASVYSLTIAPNGQILVGGDFSFLSGIPAGNLGRINADGTRDNSFTATTPSGGWVTDLKVLPSGQILALGLFDEINGIARQQIARLTSSGLLDTTFNASIINNSYFPRATLLPNNRILLTGYIEVVNGIATPNLARLNANGSLDLTFTLTANGTSANVAASNGGLIIVGSFSRLNNSDRFGVARIDINSGNVDTTFTAGVGEKGAVRKMLGDSQGRILVGGTFDHFGNTRFRNIARLDDAGLPDPGFQTGSGFMGGAERVNDILLMDDGSILVAGSFVTYNDTTRKGIALLGNDGTLSNVFNANLLTSSEIKRVSLLAGGKILISGFFGFTGGPLATGIAILNPDGSRDTTFQPTFSGGVASMAVATADGKILVTGTFTSVDGTARSFLARLNPNGSLDTSFTYNTPGFGMGQASSMIPLPDGRLYYVGPFGVTDSSGSTIAVRLLPNGTRDPEFNAPIRNDWLSLAAVEQDGRLLCFERSVSVGLPRMVVRLKTNGAFDYSFWNRNAGIDSVSSVQALAVLPNKKVLLGGDFTSYAGVPRLSLVRLENEQKPAPTVFDFDGDGKTDIGIFRPFSVSEWWITRSSNGSAFALQFGASTDRIVPADYTLDGKTDIAFFRPSTGQWYILRSEDNSFYAFPFGADGDIPVPADYDGDGKPDPAVFRPSSGTWYISRSLGVGARIVQFGASGDQPVVSDYDGDNRADIGIYRPSAGEWWIQRSTAGLLAMQFGAPTDKAVQADYTGDGKTDIATWRPSTGEWFIVRSEDFSFYGFPFGANGDVVAPGDYDGDGKFDVTVFRPSSATWFIAGSTAGTQIVQFGLNGDRPLPNAFVP